MPNEQLDRPRGRPSRTGPGSAPPVLLDQRGVRHALIVMMGCALAFPVLVEVLGVGGSVLYHPLEVAVLLAVPALAAWWTRGSVARPWGHGATGGWRWWAPALVVAVWTLLGGWGGIAVATLLFALVHVGSRQGPGLGGEVAAALVVQGSFGLFVAYLWTRYRNLWLNVTAHILANGYLVVVVLVQR